MKILGLVILFACSVLISGEKARYDNYRVYSIEIVNEQQLDILQQLENDPEGILFLSQPTKVTQKVDLVVPPLKFAYIADLFDEYNLKKSIKINNVQKLIDMEQLAVRSPDFSWKQYNDLSAFYSWIDKLLEQYPNILKEYVYGKSYENRPLRAVKVSYKPGKPMIFVEATIHAREWITGATASYLLNELLTSNDAEIRALADDYDWVFVLITNPDGYEYTHQKDRMWRKNRVPNKQNPTCIGVDLNRNFDFHHGDVGSSQQPCSETYAGPKGFSEPETSAISNLIKSFDNIKLYFSLHSYSQLLLFPYGHTTDHATNHADMNQVGQATIEAIRKRYGTEYVAGNIAETIYLASGGSIDWVYAAQNVSLTYTFELRDKGRHGFILPADQIIPNSLEFIDGLKAMIKEARALHYL